MASVALTFDELDISATRAFAYAFLASHADVFVAGAYRFWETSRALDKLLADLTPQTVGMLAAAKTADAGRIKSRLEDLHRLTANFLRTDSLEKLSRIPVLNSYISKIRNATEDLGDIVDTLALASNTDFLALVSHCASALDIKGSEDQVGGMRR